VARTPAASSLVLHSLFFCSGAAALGYQLIWSKLFAIGLGHEMPAVLATVAAFMGGMALGAWRLDRLIPRDARAGWWLAAFEFVIGGWAVLIAFAAPALNQLALSWTGPEPTALRQWSIAFLIPALALLPATAAMGATLPAMEKLLSVTHRERGSVASAYAANTFGAVCGTLLTPFVLMPLIGLSGAGFVLAVLNMSIAAVLLLRQRPPGALPECSATSSQPAPRQEKLSPATNSPARLRLALLVSGCLGMTYEAVGVRVLSQVLENTIYTYACVLAVFLLGTAAGAAAFHARRHTLAPATLLPKLVIALCVACLAGTLVAAQSNAVYDTLRHLGDTPASIIVAELLTAASVFAAPTFLMGALFSLLAQEARARLSGVGAALAWNTLGAASAPIVLVLAMPGLGYKGSFLMASVGYLALIRSARELRWSWLALPLLVAVWWSDWQFVSVPPNGRVIAQREGLMASVTVVEDAQQQRTLHVDNRFQMGGTAAADAEYRQAHIPLLLHPKPERALFLGLGTGISFSAAGLHPGLHADGVELVPEVVEVLPAFQVRHARPLNSPRLRTVVADARRFVQANSAERYDVIVGDVFHPYRDGAGSLYTREHFRALRHLLADSNSFVCQWLPLHQLDVSTLRIIARTFLEEFPNAEAWLLRWNVDVPVVALLGAAGTLPNATNAFPSAPELQSELRRLGLADPLRLRGHRLLEPATLRQFCGRAPVNTDNNQAITLFAPRAAYQKTVKPHSSLLALLEAAEWDRDLERSEDPRLNAYWSARNIYMRGLIDDAEQRHDAALEKYLESARRSPEFTAGYAQCLSIASAYAQADPPRARRILEQLIAAQPERPVAREMLRRLFPE
jgi:spermidine synthase